MVARVTVGATRFEGEVANTGRLCDEVDASAVRAGDGCILGESAPGLMATSRPNYDVVVADNSGGRCP
jgi:hypothetical protein